jgi:hypothetical protein
MNDQPAESGRRSLRAGVLRHSNKSEEPSEGNGDERVKSIQPLAAEQSERLGYRLLILAATAILLGVQYAFLDGERPHLLRTYLEPGEGFSIRLPVGMNIDKTRGSVVTEFFDSEARVAVFHERLGADATAENYTDYKARPIRRGIDPVNVTLDRVIAGPSWPVHVLRWSRRKLAYLPYDMTFYATFDFVVSPKEIWSVHIKAREEKWIDSLADEIVRSFVALPASSDQQPPRHSRLARAAPLTSEAKELLHSLFGEGVRQTFGIYEPNDPDYSSLHAIEQQLGHKFRVLLSYILIDERWTYEILEQAYAEGRLVELTLQLAPPDGNPSAAFVYDVLNGQYDAKLRGIARDIAKFGHPVIFRLNNEMNGDWVIYSGYFTSEDAEIFRATWRYVYEIFSREGATNALWVWNPHDRSFPNFRYNQSVMYDPGSQFFDIVGITGYNNGTYYPNEKWRTFDDIYAPVYAEYLQLFPGKPFMITEFASSTIGGDKAAWVKDMMSRLPAYPKIKVAVWWNGVDRNDEGRPARPYRLEGDEVMATFREGLSAFN